MVEESDAAMSAAGEPTSAGGPKVSFAPAKIPGELRHWVWRSLLASVVSAVIGLLIYKKNGIILREPMEGLGRGADVKLAET